MEIIIHQAILHVLDTTMDAPVLSGSGMEMTAEKTAYFQYHIEKLLASDDIRQCRPLPDSAFKNELEHNHDFVDLLESGCSAQPAAGCHPLLAGGSSGRCRAPHPAGRPAGSPPCRPVAGR